MQQQKNRNVIRLHLHKEYNYFKYSHSQASQLIVYGMLQILHIWN